MRRYNIYIGGCIILYILMMVYIYQNVSQLQRAHDYQLVHHYLHSYDHQPHIVSYRLIPELRDKTIDRRGDLVEGIIPHEGENETSHILIQNESELSMIVIGMIVGGVVFFLFIYILLRRMQKSVTVPSESLLRSILERLDRPILCLDECLTVMYLNSSCKTIYGISFSAGDRLIENHTEKNSVHQFLREIEKYDLTKSSKRWSTISIGEKRYYCLMGGPDV
jgi:PAS domain-containing protein